MALELLSQPKVEVGKDFIDEYGQRTVEYVVHGKFRSEDSRSQSMEEKNVGRLIATFFSSPVPLVWVRDIDVEEGARSQHISSMLMRTIEQKILDEHRVGILQDHVGIYRHTPSQAVGMYQRHGWEQLRDSSSNTLVFNIRDMVRNDIKRMYENIDVLYATGERYGDLA